MATISPDDDLPQKKLKSIPCLDHPGADYLDRDLVDEEEPEEPYDVFENPRKATLADLNFYQGLAEKVLTYYNSKEGENLLLKEVLIADRDHAPETVVWMNFIARAEDDSKLFYFFAKLEDGPYPKYRDLKEMLLKESFKEPEISDFHVKYYCLLETHNSGSLFLVFFFRRKRNGRKVGFGGNGREKEGDECFSSRSFSLWRDYIL